MLDDGMAERAEKNCLRIQNKLKEVLPHDVKIAIQGSGEDQEIELSRYGKKVAELGPEWDRDEEDFKSFTVVWYDDRGKIVVGDPNKNSFENSVSGLKAFVNKLEEQHPSKKASLVARLDCIASELELVDPRISLAIDQISDRIIESCSAEDAKKWIKEEENELETAESLEEKFEDLHKVIKKFVEKSKKEVGFAKSKTKDLS